MNTGARNHLAGTVTALTPGDVNDEVEITLPDGHRVVAIVTHGSATSLPLAVGPRPSR